MERRKFLECSLRGATGLTLIDILFGCSSITYKRNVSFNNNASQVGFIGHYSSVEELIDADAKELKRIRGSFEEIADRIKEFLEYAKNKVYDRPNKESIDPIVIIRYATTRGIQFCPFEGCKTGWNDVVNIKNSYTEEKLTINRGIEHLARDHHLLEKGNEYEIVPEKFYKHFMPQD